jgi:hypothetical protein
MPISRISPEVIFGCRAIPMNCADLPRANYQSLGRRLGTDLQPRCTGRNGGEEAEAVGMTNPLSTTFTLFSALKLFIHSMARCRTYGVIKALCTLRRIDSAIAGSFTSNLT